MRQSWIWTLLLAAPLACGIAGCGGKTEKKSSEGDDETPKKPKVAAAPLALPTAEKKLDLSYITDDFVAAMVVHPGRVMNSQVGQDFIAVLKEEKPGEIDKGLDFLKSNFGVEPDKVDQVIVLVDGMFVDGLPAMAFGGGPPKTMPGMIVRYTGTLDEAKLLPALTKFVQERSAGKKKPGTPPTMPTPEKKMHDGKPYYSYNGGNEAFAFVGGNTLLGGPEATLHKMLSAGKSTSALAKRLSSIGAEHDLILVAAGQPIESLLGSLAGMAGPENKSKGELAAKVKSIAITLSVTGNPLGSVVLGMQDSSAATELADVLNKEAVTKGKAEFAKSKQSGKISAENSQVLDEIVESLAVGAKGNDVIIAVARPSQLDNLREILKANMKAKKSAKIR